MNNTAIPIQTKASRAGRAVMAYFSDEEFAIFEEMRLEDVRNTSDMLRYLLRQEIKRRQAQAEAQPAPEPQA